MFIDVGGAWAVAEQAMAALVDPSSLDAAETYSRAAEFQAILGDPGGALTLLERALRIYEALPVCVGHARALARRELIATALGREADAAASAAQATRVAAELGDPVMYRAMLVGETGHDAIAGDLRLALSRISEALDIVPGTPDPIGDVYLAGCHAEILRMGGAGADAIAAASRPGLDAAAAWGLDTFPVACLRANLASSMRHEGDVRGAAEVIDPVTDDSPTQDRNPVHYERATLDMLRGRLDAALGRLEALAGFPIAVAVNRIECTEHASTVEIWCGLPRQAFERSLAVLDDCVATDAADHMGRLLMLAARSAVDMVDTDPAAAGSRRALLARLRGLQARSARDPFAPRLAFPERPALAATWAAETARLSGRDSLAGWAGAAQGWDRLTHPHEASYCRWRAAQAALRNGDVGTASRLLRAATRGARAHVPLLAGIGETRASIGS